MKCSSCKEPAEDGRKRPVIKPQVAFKGDFTEPACEACGESL